MSSLVDRTRAFAVEVIRLSSSLPRNRVANALGDQLLRAGTSPGAHFREAIRARSKAEYVAKLNSGLMELEETVYWCELVIDCELAPVDRVQPIMHEARELTAIFVSLIKRWKAR